ncbi:sensor histidine kinase [Paenibacillus sp. J5C_2022]|uniref:sensor histidine kinase n=1 Tax=Paenibacillus sp. J5C2022 TaxID=2977129 RepID=UPI0021CFA7ED|nr:sensor histidine kinase [Paenibacillus sp. J5C2022]MCU6712153.1 sensor histidine kinase [Paenibacillus sp. J5C2022]
MKHFKIHSIFLRNFLLIVCLIILPVCGIGAAVYYVYNKVMQEEVSSVHLIGLSRLRDMIDMTVREIDDFALQIASDEASRWLLEEPYPATPDYAMNTQLTALRQKLTPVNKISGQFINSVYLYADRSNYVMSSNLSLWKMDWFTDNGWWNDYLTHKKESDRYWVSARAAKQFIGEQKPKQLLSLYYMAPLDEKVKQGAVIVNIDTERLGHFINNVNDLVSEDIYIIDKDGIILYNSEPALLNRSLADIGSLKNVLRGSEGTPVQMSIGGRTESVAYLSSQYNDWIFISVIPLQLYDEKNAHLRTYLYVIFAAGFIVALLLAWLIAMKVFQPIRKIISIVENPDKWNYGELEKQEPHRNEIRQVAAAITRSHDKQVVMEQELRKRLVLLKQAQNVALQSQISPHFLYNTLETINWNAMRLTGGENKVSDMITSLSLLLRLSLETPSNLIPVQDELQHVRHYIEILMIRYKNSFTVAWDIDEYAMRSRIPKFTLQPLVENAVYHGLKPRQDKGTIRITAERRDGRIFFAIADDGVGIDPERTAHINNELQHGYSEPGAGDHIGIKNVNQRIKLTFGEDYGIVIVSRPNEGTCVQLTIPAPQ